MDQEILQKFDEQQKKLEQVYQSVKRMRKYFLWTLIISVVVIVLPLIGLLLVIPQFFSLYSGANLGL
jgi:type II secretory pathway component PulF